MNEFLSILSAWLLDLLVLGTALLAIASLTLVFVRRPAARMAISRGTLLGLATLFLLTALPAWPRHSLDDIFSKKVAEAEEWDDPLAKMTETETVFAPPLVLDGSPTTNDLTVSTLPTAQPFSTVSIFRLLPLLWLGTAAFALAYIFLGAWRAFRLLRFAEKAPNWSEQELKSLVPRHCWVPRLKTSQRIATAIAMIAWRPHILLATKSVNEQNKAAVRAALAHEWAHIRHGDLWLLALERLLLPVFCLHPLFWLLRRQIRMDQEILADAAAAGNAPVEYAEALLSWAKAESQQAAPPLGIAALYIWERPSNLSRRVEMLLHTPSLVATRGSRLWKWLAPLFLISLVIGLSLLTLKPAAVAQDEFAAEGQVQPRKQKPKKAKKERPMAAAAKDESVSPDQKSPQESTAGAQIFLEITIAQIDHAALEKAGSSLGDLVQAASEDQCRLEGELIVAELSAKQYSSLTAEFKKANSLKVLSQPKVATLDRQAATIQVGGQVQVTRLDETVNGASRERVEYRNIGETMVIRPVIHDQDPSRLTLEIVAEHAALAKGEESPIGDKTPKFITNKFRLQAEAALGKTLVIAERKPKKGSGRSNSILLAIEPQKTLLIPKSAPNSPAKAEGHPLGWVHGFHTGKDLTAESCLKCHAVTPPKESSDASEPLVGKSQYDSLRQENAALRKKIQDLLMKVIDSEVQIRWLREAAALGGKNKVNDDEFLRRVYLDLTGRIPTAEETRAFLQDQDKQKRDKLIDKLLEQKVFRNPEEATKWRDALESRPEPAASLTRSAPEEHILQVVRLTYISANDAAIKLTAIFELASEKPTIVAEERTNSLLLRGSQKTLKSAIALLGVLDGEPKPASDSKVPEPKANENSIDELKKLDIRKAEAGLQAAKAEYERIQILRKENAVSDLGVARASYQLRHAELVLEAASNPKNVVKLRELELLEAEAALRAAEASLAEGLASKGTLSPQQLDGLSLDLRKKKAGVTHAELRLERAKTLSREKP